MFTPSTTFNLVQIGELESAVVSNARWLANRALAKRYCFVAMPFRPELRIVYRKVKTALQNVGWIVERGDEIQYPRRVTDAIVVATLESDLVIADLTGGNPNVFYELGVAHALGCDVLLLTQEKELPFDLRAERAIFYNPSKQGLIKLGKELQEMVGSGFY